MLTVYLPHQTKTLPDTPDSTLLSLVSDYLKETILPESNTLEIDINSFFEHEFNVFDTFGSVRLEILYYEKTYSVDNREQVVLYGVAENVRFEVKSYTLFYDTYWFDKQYSHQPVDLYFDSKIVGVASPSSIISGTSFELVLRDANKTIIGHCTGILFFGSELQNRDRPPSDNQNIVPGNVTAPCHPADTFLA